MYSNLIFSLFLITSLKPPCKCCRILLLEYFYFSTFSILYLFKQSYWIPFLVCRQDQIEKYSAQCATYLKYGFCTAANIRHFMEQNCPVTCRVCQGKLLTNSKFTETDILWPPFCLPKTNLDKKIFHWSFFFKIPLFESGNWPPSWSIFHVRQEKVGAALVGDLSQHFKCLNNHFSHYFWLLTQGNVPGFPDMSQHSSCDTLWRILMIIGPFANARLKTRVVEAGGRWGRKMINMWLRQCKTCSVLVKWYNWYNW